MQSILAKLEKLRGRTPSELRERSVQALTVLAERRDWLPTSRIPSDPEFFLRRINAAALPGEPTANALLEAFRSRARTSFFPSLRDREQTVAVLRARLPDAERETVAAANRICDGRFDLLGYRDLRFGEPIDWHLDPVAGRSAPLVHWSRIPYLDAAQVGDHKVIWEINRHQYFVTLGQAYWFTGDERFAHVFVQHLSSWMDANPPKIGINWASSLELAFRSISWIWALHFFRDSSCLTPTLFLRALKFLELQGRHAERFLSTYFSPNTHLTGEALGLWYLGVVFPELRCAERWRKRGRAILVDQVGIQVRDDGVYFEQATFYQRYTTDFYLHLCALSRATGAEVEPCVEQKLGLLLNHLMHLTRPDGTTPLVGDDDGGRFIAFEQRAPNDFRATLATGAALFGRSDLRYVAGEPSQETLWLLGTEAMGTWDAIEPAAPAALSRAFPDGGYYVMRDGWDIRANYLLVDCGPHGIFNCGHAHADALAIDVAALGETSLVERGTYTYTAEPALRDQFRLSQSHNTLSVDQQSSSVPAGPFTWRHVARSCPLAWISRERFDYFEGEHDGYERLTPPATHRRSIFFVRGQFWVIRDRVFSEGEHQLEIRYHLAPGAELARVDQGGYGTAALRIEVFGAQPRILYEPVPMSPVYGNLTGSVVCSAAQQGRGDQEMISLLIPRATAEEYHVREEAAEGGRMIRITGARGDDCIAISGNGCVVTADVLADAEWAWVRRSASDGSLQECVLLGARRLQVDGNEIFCSAGSVRHVHIRWSGEQVEVDADASGEFEVAVFGASRVAAGGASFSSGGRERCTVHPDRAQNSEMQRDGLTLAMGG